MCLDRRGWLGSRNNPTPRSLVNGRGVGERSWAHRPRSSITQHMMLPPNTPACEMRTLLIPVLSVYSRAGLPVPFQSPAPEASQSKEFVWRIDAITVNIVRGIGSLFGLSFGPIYVKYKMG